MSGKYFVDVVGSDRSSKKRRTSLSPILERIGSGHQYPSAQPLSPILAS